MLLLPSIALGQVNLVPNGSFELFDICPTGNPCSGHIEYATGWYEPITCSTDFIHECANPGGCGIPTAHDVSPADGQGMIALIPFSGGSNSREYAAIELIEPLIADTLYSFEAQFRLISPDLVSIGSFGVYFSSDSATDYSNFQSIMDVQNQLQSNPDSLMSDQTNWYLWQDTLVAQGGERFAVIGNFLEDSQTPFYQPSWISSSGYFIDDVRLIQIPKPNSVRALDVGYSVSPNPSNSSVQLEYSGNLRPKNIHVRSVTGSWVKTVDWQKTLNVSDIDDGVYLLQVVFDNGAVSTERLVISH
ncbi:MAG: T9SS type A sorting domain-containing protein [Flavobacteriales bacterium]|nr:T9SS type A sorting domain-containing protein [Flavobacteriales bacterium]